MDKSERKNSCTDFIRRIVSQTPAVFCLVALPALGFCAQPETPALTLADCYRLALAQSELIAADGEQIRQAQARFLQALGAVMPHASFSHEETIEDAGGDADRSYEQKFVFTQTLFSGFREFAAIAAARYDEKQRKNELARAQQLLFADVADAFYLLFEVREDLKTLGIVKQAFIERIGELKKRELLGKSRPSEVVNTQTQLYITVDQIESVKSKEMIARELLEFLIGRAVGGITESGEEYALKDEEDYLSGAPSRPDVLAADFSWQAAKKRALSAKGEFLPTVKAEADYFTHRSSSQDWEALLKISIPIFEGTTTYGRVKEADSLARENELLLQRAGRLARQDIHNAYVRARYSFRRSAILAQALKSAELNYELQGKDYRINVVNNLDVLTALQDLQDVRRTYKTMYYESRRFYWQLCAAAGLIHADKYR